MNNQKSMSKDVACGVVQLDLVNFLADSCLHFKYLKKVPRKKVQRKSEKSQNRLKSYFLQFILKLFDVWYSGFLHG